MYSFEFSSYEKAICCAAYVNKPEVVSCYIHLGLARARQCDSAKDTKIVYLQMISTLENAICDTLLPLCWRKLCAKQIYRLMPLLYEITSISEYQKATNRIRLFCAYFLQTP